ncbi:Transcription termination factor, mitochondrial/chloroplastic [Dillenia turbinata]|uniref:Transcription termination factor, mitochondrial/chloroplastic n=1 Tax=Dillenia turbinata TaxID=194707 RepID=A0AAN8YY63_9MAGN
MSTLRRLGWASNLNARIRSALNDTQTRYSKSTNPLVQHLSNQNSQIPHQNFENVVENESDQENFRPKTRTHNFKSTNFLLKHLSDQNPQIPDEYYENFGEKEADREKIRLLEWSLVSQRNPIFPGSIYSQNSPINDSVETSKPPLNRLFAEDDEKLLMKAVEIRRKVSFEVLMEAMKRGKFGITYSTNLVSGLSEFIDFVMIKAAEMKRLPEYKHLTFNARARAFVDESNIVPLIRWLKHNKLSHPQIAKLICMSRGNPGSIRRIVEWLKSKHAHGRFLGAALMKAGDNILDRSLEELDEIISYLESNGVRMEWMGYVITRCPQLLSYDIEEVKTRTAFYLDMGMNEKDFGTMVFDFPKVLGYFTLEEMNQKVNYLKEFGFSHEDVGRLLAFKPQLMACSIEDRWKPLVKYLYYLGVQRDGMKRILAIKPMVYCVDLEATIVPKVRFLQDIGIREDAIGNMLVKFPSLLTYSLQKKIRPVVIFLLTKAGVKQKDIGKVIALGPELLGCNIANKLEVNVKYFLSLGITLKVLGEMIADFPMLLRYNVDVLRPKYRYLRRTMVRPLHDVIEFPRFFSYSLEHRIIPRHKVLVENRINFKLRYMLASTDEEFAEKVRGAVERRQRFESGIGALDDSLLNFQAVDDSSKLSSSQGPQQLSKQGGECGHP